MLKINIIAVGKDKDTWVTEGCKHYTKLLSRYAEVQFKAVPSPQRSRSLSPDEIKKAEAARLDPLLDKGTIIALADTGQKLDSRQFAQLLEKLQVSSRGFLNFIIGGPYGLHESLLTRADMIVSLSSLTFSHQVVRLVLMEQLYRAFSILHGTDYHK